MKLKTNPQSSASGGVRKLIFVFAAFISLALAGRVSATTFNVNTFSDTHAVTPSAGTGLDSTGKISLRSALEAVESVGGTQTVNLPAGTYNLSLGTITFGDVAQNLTITGASAATTIVNMTTTAQNRIFLIGTTGTLPNVNTSISNVQFTGGKLTGDNYGGGAIIAGGPSNSLTLTNCIFQNNTIAAAVAGAPEGGAVRYNGGGSLTITGCVFNNNSNPLSAGGAVSYFFENLVGIGNGVVTITNSTFTNNSVTATGATGGALDIAAQGRITAGVTFTVSVLRNTFSGNSASGASGSGGAISVTNSFDVGNTAQFNDNRIFGNTSTVAPSAMAVAGGSQGNVDATDNWWGLNSGPGGAAAKLGPGGGTLSLGTWLQLRHSASPTTIVTGGTSTLTADILGRNSGGPISAATLNGMPAFPATATTIFSNAVRGTLSSASTQFTNGQATATFTGTSPGGLGGADAAVDGQSAINAPITVNQPASITSAASATFTTGTNGSFQLAASGFPTSFTFTNTGAGLPGGVTLSAGGLLSGTPNAGTGGTYNLTFQVSNG
ncbi:MAG: putative Ig domain-containing protein, partial [Chthoniobacterales bacterium]